MKRWKRKTARAWVHAKRFVLHNILHTDDPPHRLALGIAVGLWVTFTPTFGAQMVLVVFLSWLLGANRIVGVPLVWLTNPATFVPIYYPSYRVGLYLLQSPPKGQAWWQELRHPPEGLDEPLWFYWDKIIEIIWPLALGSVVLATVIAVVGYYASLSLIRAYRTHRSGHTMPPG